MDLFRELPSGGRRPNGWDSYSDERLKYLAYYTREYPDLYSLLSEFEDMIPWDVWKTQAFGPVESLNVHQRGRERPWCKRAYLDLLPKRLEWQSGRQGRMANSSYVRLSVYSNYSMGLFDVSGPCVTVDRNTLTLHGKWGFMAGVLEEGEQLSVTNVPFSEQCLIIEDDGELTPKFFKNEEDLDRFLRLSDYTGGYSD